VKALRVLFIVLLLLASINSVAAMPQFLVKLFGVCVDGDDGPKNPDEPLPFIGIPSFAQDRSGKVFDECVSVHGEKISASKVIRERFCVNGVVQTKEYDCEKYGFTACVDVPGKGARCVEDVVPSTRCGDGAVQFPEQCDPPGVACMKGGKPGVCNAGCQCVVPPPKKCGNKRLDAGEQCDPPGANCVSPGGKPSVCNPGCQCPEPPKKKCGDKVVQPPEQCDPPGKACKSAKGVGVCSAVCGCDVPEKPRCGDSKRDAGEQCDPPGMKCVNAAGLDSTCSQDCKCPVTRVRTWCGNNYVDPWEDCDPPGVRCQKGGIFGICNDYCMCVGKDGIILTGERTEIAIGRTPTTPTTTETTTPPQPQKSCEELCAERGKTTQQPDWSQDILSQLQQYSCVSGAQITLQGTLTLTGPGVSCRCYSNDPPTVNVDRTPPVCQTPCGPVQCGSSAQCACPDAPNCVLTASCTWNGWKWAQGRPVPMLGAQAAAQAS